MLIYFILVCCLPALGLAADVFMRADAEPQQPAHSVRR
jgi:hypothetical protein